MVKRDKTTTYTHVIKRKEKNKWGKGLNRSARNIKL